MVFSLDFLSTTLSAWAAFSITIGEFSKFDIPLILFVAFSFCFASVVYWKLGLYRALFRYSGFHAAQLAAVASIMHFFTFGSFVFFLELEGVPRLAGFIQSLLLFSCVAGCRVIAQLIFEGSFVDYFTRRGKPRALIYGAGSAGRQIAAGLRSTGEMLIVGFVDDDRSLWGQFLEGKKIQAPESAGSVINSEQVSHILVALPSVSMERRNEIIGQLSCFAVKVQTLPSISDLVGDEVTVDDFRDLNVDELIGRKTLSSADFVTQRNLASKTVVVTGAGGSIGSELCRQLLFNDLKCLILIDTSELALYSISQELNSLQNKTNSYSSTAIEVLLCSVQNQCRVESIIDAWRPEIIFHTAAYKHVSIVEENVFEGVENNVIGTLSMAKVAAKMNVRDFVLISSDKAVRPTTVMGATKRVSEMIIQAIHQENIGNTKFSIVRFGNVFGSSGSVIPKFKKQIENGGPVTVTHPDVRRYFMSISEAAQLVLEACAISNQGDILILEMGDPIRIIDLANKMISLSGQSVKDEANPRGDIEIQITGLPFGEKLSEELWINQDPSETPHPKILRESGEPASWDRIKPLVEKLKINLNKNDTLLILQTMKELVEDFDYGSEHHDLISNKLQKSRKPKRLIADNAQITSR
jgi:FlaA1/EpsC-like NDP-sugar epimerase